MNTITNLDGKVIDIDEKHIILIAGPYPSDVGPHTYVYGVTPKALITAEPPQSLVGRLGVSPPLAVLTRPNGTSVWLKGSAVSAVRSPVPTEIPPGLVVNAVVIVGGLHQAAQEDVPTARKIINALGGNV